MIRFDNPELTRMGYLELTPVRMIAMPAVLALVLMLAVSTEVESAGIAGGALAIYVLLTHFWGLRQATESVTEEFRARTWDAQRMSIMSPRELALGKLFGANLFTWYGALMCLAVFVFFMRHELSAARIAWSVAFVLGSALLLQGIAMFVALLSPGARSLRLPYLLILVFVALPMLGGLYPLLTEDRGGSFLWYGRHLPTLQFAAVSAWLFALWAIVGVIRLMAGELQVRTTPAVWCGFLAFITVFASGFVIDQDTAPLSAAVFILMTGCLAFNAGGALAAWFDSRDPLRFKRIGLALAAGRTRRVLEELPAWSAALAVAGVAAIVLVPALAAVSARPTGAVIALLDQTGRFGPLTPAALVLLALRDVAFMHGVAFTRTSRRGELLIVVYLLLVYLLLPALLAVTGARAIILPNPFTQPVVAVVVFAIHLAMVLVWVRMRWRALGSA